MSNVHFHLHVADLEISPVFYERFLGAPPSKTKPGYAKFLPDFAPINLALSAGEPERGREEMDTNGCYANQDKFWLRDPDGVEGEVYHLNDDIEEDATEEASVCCPPFARMEKRP
jgi:hypothetical protein